MSRQPVMSLNASAGALVLGTRRVLQLSRTGQDEAYYVDYTPPARDAITLPRNVVYVLVGVVLVLVATYAIVGHLIKDLMHDLADWMFGPKPVEDDGEEGGPQRGDRPAVSSRLTVEKNGPLPGFQQEDQHPPPPRTAPPAPPAHPSTHSVTFVCPPAPYVTSL